MVKTAEVTTNFRIKSLSSNSIYITTEDLFLLQNTITNTFVSLSSAFAATETQASLTPSLYEKK
jgi:hypothetical protein